MSDFLCRRPALLLPHDEHIPTVDRVPALRGKEDATGSRAGPAPCSLLAQSGHVSRGVGRDRILWEQVAAAFTRQHHERDHRCQIGGVIGAVA